MENKRNGLRDSFGNPSRKNRCNKNVYSFSRSDSSYRWHRSHRCTRSRGGRGREGIATSYWYQVTAFFFLLWQSIKHDGLVCTVVKTRGWITITDQYAMTWIRPWRECVWNVPGYRRMGTNAVTTWGLGQPCLIRINKLISLYLYITSLDTWPKWTNMVSGSMHGFGSWCFTEIIVTRFNDSTFSNISVRYIFFIVSTYRHISTSIERIRLLKHDNCIQSSESLLRQTRGMSRACLLV